VKPHVLVARLDNAGDVLLAGPAVRAVAAVARRVTVLCGPAGEAAARLLPGVDDIVVFEAPWVSFEGPATDRAAIDALVDRVAALDVDRAFVLTSFHQSPLPLALLLRMAGVGQIAATSVDFPGRLLDVRHGVVEGVHEVEQSLSLVATLGHHLPAGDDGRLAVLRPLPAWRPCDEPYVVVHPGASVPARGWDAGRAAALVGLLAEEGRRAVVTGGPGERALTAQVAGSAGIDLGAKLDFAGLAGVLEGASVVVSGNTGPAHLAAAVGTPVVSIFAPVVPAERWRPWGVASVVLGDQEIACAGCRARTCPLAEQHCLAAVTPEAVAGALRSLDREAVRGSADRRTRGPSGPPAQPPRAAGQWPFPLGGETAEPGAVCLSSGSAPA
jgi:ADP-heptose:LPS heptosyltransferase